MEGVAGYAGPRCRAAEAGARDAQRGDSKDDQRLYLGIVHLSARRDAGRLSSGARAGDGRGQQRGQGGAVDRGATLDRYLQSIKQPQVFGTQLVPDAKGQMWQGDYKHELLSNSLRAAMCVRSYEKQVEQVKQVQKQSEAADFNTGQFPCP
jgi:hypothetical protein